MLKTNKPTCGIHTIHISTDDVLTSEISNHIRRCLTKDFSNVNRTTGELTTRLIINPNRLFEDDGWCTTYSEFESNLIQILEELGISTYKTLRVDFSFNYSEDNYAELHKLHKFICILAASNGKVVNRYECTDPLSLTHKNIVVKNQYFEIENYNKEIESAGKSNVKNRLEFRSKKLSQENLNYKGIPLLIDNWIQTVFVNLEDRFFRF